MKTYRPLPGWLKWLMRILGPLIVLASLVGLYIAVILVIAIVQAWPETPAGLRLMVGLVGGVKLIFTLLWLWLGIWMTRRSFRKPTSATPRPGVSTPPELPPESAPVSRAQIKTPGQHGNKRWSSCNVLLPAEQFHYLWQFNAGGNKFELARAESKRRGEPLPAALIKKDWQSLFQPKLNIAWLPADKVFLRAVQLPKADFTETISMVELQLEKLSPLPVAQAAWSFELLPNADPGMQTAIVVVVARSHVEEFLGALEGQHYLADRLELSFLDQLRATRIDEDGIWIYPAENKISCLVAWWYGGVLHSLSIVHLPAGEGWTESLRAQLGQMAWAGELEGWITAPPRYHLVVDPAEAASFEERVRTAVQQPVEIIPPLPPHELAALTARRAALADPRASLLPVEFAARYRQQFVDRLWMRGLGAVLLLYILVVVGYLGVVRYAKFQRGRIDDRAIALGGAYTNSLQLKARLQVMRDQIELKFAALDCWKAAAELMPPELTLESINLDRGRKLTLYGTAASEDSPKVIDYNDALMKVTARGQPLFTKVNPPNVSLKPGTQQIGWNFSCDLKRTDSE